MRFFWLCILLFPLFFSSSCHKSSASNPYNIARDPSWHPLDLMGKGQAVDGFSTDLIKEIAAEQDFYFDWILSDWNLLYRELQKNRYDAILSSITPSDITDAEYSFSEPYLLLGPVLVVPQRSKIFLLNDMQEKVIGVVASTNDDLIAQTIPNIVIKRYESPALLLEDLSLGKIDGGLVAVLEAKAFIQDLYSGQLKIVTHPLNDNGLRLITLKNAFPELISAFNEGLLKSKEDATYYNLLRKWNLF